MDSSSTYGRTSRAVNSDQYEGSFIPAGASVLGNTWYVVIIAEVVFSVFELHF